MTGCYSFSRQVVTPVNPRMWLRVMKLRQTLCWTVRLFWADRIEQNQQIGSQSDSSTDYFLHNALLTFFTSHARTMDIFLASSHALDAASRTLQRVRAFSAEMSAVTHFPATLTHLFACRTP